MRRAYSPPTTHAAPAVRAMCGSTRSTREIAWPACGELDDEARARGVHDAVLICAARSQPAFAGPRSRHRPFSVLPRLALAVSVRTLLTSWGTGDAAQPTRHWFPVLLGAICWVAASVLLHVTARWGLGCRPTRSHISTRHETCGTAMASTARHRRSAAPRCGDTRSCSLSASVGVPPVPGCARSDHLGPWGLEEAARLLNAVLLAAIVALVGWLVLRATRSGAAALLAAGALAVSSVGLDLYSAALSEPLFVLLSYGAIALVACYLSAQRPVFLWGAAVATALALLARFAGVPLLGATALPLFLYGRGGWRTRLARTAAFTGLSVLPLVAWLVRNWHLTGSATGRQLAWHPLSAHRPRPQHRRVHDAHGSRRRSRRCTWSARARHRRGCGGCRDQDPCERPHRGFDYYLVASLLVYLVLYPVFLVGSISVADAQTNLDRRFLFPMYPGMVVLASWVLVIAFRSPSAKSVTRAALVAGIVVFLCGNAVGLAVHAQRFRRDGDGYSGGRLWSESPAIAHIRTLPPSTTIYSDRPDAIYFQTHRVARSIPATSNPMTAQPNPNLTADNRELRGRITGSDVFVLFAADYRWYLEDAPTLEKELGLIPTFRTTDARFLRKRVN